MNERRVADQRGDGRVARRRFLRGAAATAVVAPAVVAATANQAAAGGGGGGNPPTAPMRYRALDPYRCYDSRWTLLNGTGGAAITIGPLVVGQSRSVEVWPAFTTVAGVGTFQYAGLASGNTILAVTYNLTIARTTGSGFLMVGPGGSVPTSSHINWSAAGVTIANAGTVKINPGPSGLLQNIEVRAGGAALASTDFIIDITGYYETDPVIL